MTRPDSAKRATAKSQVVAPFILAGQHTGLSLTSDKLFRFLKTTMRPWRKPADHTIMVN